MRLIPIKRAIISVADKSGVAEFARQLRERGVEIISTGGTLKSLREAAVEAQSISDVTGFPEILDGRVKTLHPKIHAGLLAVTENPAHRQQLAEFDVTPIDLVVVNLYPFAQTIAGADCTVEHAIENIDIGGPAMVRSGAKNYRYVGVVTLNSTLFGPASMLAAVTEAAAHAGFAVSVDSVATLDRPSPPKQLQRD